MSGKYKKVLRKNATFVEMNLHSVPMLAPKPAVSTTSIKTFGAANAAGAIQITTTKTININPLEHPPVLRIGTKVKVQEEQPKAGDVIEGGKRIGVVTIIDRTAERQDISALDFLRQGRNVSTFELFCKTILPLVRICDTSFETDPRGEIDFDFPASGGAFGQNDYQHSGDASAASANAVIAYDDMLAGPAPAAARGNGSVGNLNPVEYIRKGSYVAGYPIVTDGKRDFGNYRDPDALQGSTGFIHRDGAIEVFEIRRAFANTNSADIQINGIRGDFGSCHQESGQLSDQKGSSIIDSKFEFKQAEYDWFEDCQDLAFSENVFSYIGSQKQGENFYSLDGYISDGIYKSSPFVDADAIDKYSLNYDHIPSSIKNNFLTGSARDISDIGSRYKSLQNGFILRPKYDNVIQTVLGTDSIAFSGLLRE